MSSAIYLYLWALLILQPSRHFTYVTTQSLTLPSLYLHHSSFSNPSVASPTSQFTPQPFFCFSYVTGSSLTSPGEPPMLLIQEIENIYIGKYVVWDLLLSHWIFTYVTWLLQHFRHFTYVTAHSPTLLLHLRHSSFSNPFFTSPTSQALHLIHLASRPWLSGSQNQSKPEAMRKKSICWTQTIQPIVWCLIAESPKSDSQ